MELGQDLLDGLVAHARNEAPNECCGIVGSVNGRATSFYPARNRFESPMRFEIHPEDLFEIYESTERRGEESAVYHSHPNTEAYPSQTDVNLARWWPGALWLICSLAGAAPVVRAFRIDGPEVEEVELVVE
jgi:[CysO sulfur-carrier protein]-S-L-cysteine hydrolase